MLFNRLKSDFVHQETAAYAFRIVLVWTMHYIAATHVHACRVHAYTCMYRVFISPERGGRRRVSIYEAIKTREIICIVLALATLHLRFHAPLYGGYIDYYIWDSSRENCASHKYT